MSKERLILGQVPAQEQTFHRRSQAARREQPQNQEVYKDFQVTPLIEAALRADWRHWQEQPKQKKIQTQEILEAIYGQGARVPEYIHPSIASFCLRWVAYQGLGYPEAEPTAKSILSMKMGSAIHWSLSRTIKDFIPGEAETNFVIDDPDVSGRIDFFFPHPRLEGQYQIWEFKSVSDYVFRQIKRKGLPEYLRGTKNIYQSLPEHRKQVLLYMWGKRHRGLEVICGNIIYINRNNGEMKEALVSWDALAEYDVVGDDSEKCLVPQIRDTQIQIEKLKEKMEKTGERPGEDELPKPTVESSHVCARFCPFRGFCHFGQRFAAGEVKRQEKRRPQYVYRKLGEEAQVMKEKMEKLGLVQAQLPGFEGLPKPARRRTSQKKEKQPVLCGECGGEMRRDERGIAFCPLCGGGG